MVRINPEIFRAYDIRGLAEEDLPPEVVFLFGQAAGRYFLAHNERQVLVGRDNRLSSKRIRDHLVSGLTTAGCRVVDLGEVITPLLYYARERLKINAAIMITASHNPPEFNGFKVALGPATLHGEEIQRLYHLMEELNGEIPPESPSPRAGQVEECELHADYLQMLTEKIKLGPRKLKVAVDCGNGTASLFAEQYFNALGCEVIALFSTSDGSFPHHQPDPVQSVNLVALRETVLREGADLGIGFDGDGDRLGVVDDKGEIIWGDRLMILYWREILPKYPGTTCIVEVKCSQALVEEIKRLGGKAIFYKTGHSLIKAKMREVGAVFTGEMSGHMFFADEYYGFDDAFYAAGRLLRLLSHGDQTLNQLLADDPKYYATAETRVGCPDHAKFTVVDRIRQTFQKSHEIIDIDGVRVLFPDGWGLVRASNTQPVIVARCEAKTAEALEEITKELKDALCAFPEVEDFEWEM
ncbi:MAG: phosphomannomutase/phosphoglucomutase [Firmicutes bacterium]|nr:phosphomannomutase/phosphoglucomutase [Bacillota bacterium]